MPAVPHHKQLVLDASKAAALESLQQQLARMEILRATAGEQALEMPLRPAVARPATATLNQLTAQTAQARAELQQFGIQHCTVDDVRTIVNNRVAAAHQVPLPTDEQRQQAPVLTAERQQELANQAELLIQQMDTALVAQVDCINAEADWIRYAA